LANDIGFKLNSGAHLTSLRRIKSGKFTIEMAKSVEDWIDIIKAS
jgi:tRNA U55 pseudouridine synthase TruB